MLRRHETTISSWPQSLVAQLTLSVQPVPGRNDAGAAWGLFGNSDFYDAKSCPTSAAPGSENDKNQEKATWNIRQNTILETSGCSHTMKNSSLSYLAATCCLYDSYKQNPLTVSAMLFCHIRLVFMASPPFCTQSLSKMDMEMAVLSCIGCRWSQQALAKRNDSTFRYQTHAYTHKFSYST